MGVPVHPMGICSVQEKEILKAQACCVSEVRECKSKHHGSPRRKGRTMDICTGQFLLLSIVFYKNMPLSMVLVSLSVD